VIQPGYKNFYFYAAVDPFLGRAFVLLLPWVNAEVVNVFLAKLAEEFPTQRILLIWDRAGFHVAKTLRVPDRIRLHFLPPYSPELNPTERLWRWLRRHPCRNRRFETLDEVGETLTRELNALSDQRLAQLCACDYLGYGN
jgi:transposase